MSRPTWRQRLKEFRDFLVFWGPVPDATKSGEAKEAWQRDLRQVLTGRSDETLDAFAARWQARYDETESTRGTVTARANSLLLFVGVITTGAGLIGQSLAGAPGGLIIAFVAFGIPLLYAAVAAAVLAVRAQLVGQWDTPRVDVADATDERAVKLTYAVAIFVAAEQNRARLRRPVSFLRDGQYYAIAGIAGIAVLAILSVAAAAVMPPSDATRAGAWSESSVASQPSTTRSELSMRMDSSGRAFSA
ncbi:MAG: hypothetical protein ACR2GO_09495 [Candidatus Limnocylindria bacterium]